jgi:preprotein translocase subunit SecA
MSFLTKIFGDSNEKYIKSLAPVVEKVNSFSPDFEKLTDGQLKEKNKRI